MWAMVIFLAVGVFGFICAILSLFFISKNTAFRNAFGYICAVHGIAEGTVLFAFLSWGIVIFISGQLFEESVVGIAIGHLTNFLYFYSMYLHLLKSLNCFCAIIFPIKYRIWFTTKVVIFLLLLTLIIAFIQIFQNVIFKCDMIFKGDKLQWTPCKDCKCNIDVAKYNDIVTCSLTMSISILCDLTTFCYLNFYKKSSNVKNDTTKFFTHAFLTTLIYTSMMILFYLNSDFTKQFWGGFVTRTLSWIGGHTLNQFTFILFFVLLKEKQKAVKISATLTAKNFK